MAYKILGQDKPDSLTLIDVYTVPIGSEAVISSIVVCNQESASATFRVSVAASGAADDPGQYLYYDFSVAANTTAVLKAGITLRETDILRVQSSSGNISFNVFGLEKEV